MKTRTVLKFTTNPWLKILQKNNWFSHFRPALLKIGLLFHKSPHVQNVLTVSVCMNEYFWYLLECDCCRNMAKMQDLIWIFNKSLCKLCWFSQTKMCICFLPLACYSYNNRKKYILLEIEIFTSNLCWYSQIRQSSILYAGSLGLIDPSDGPSTR